MAQCFLKVALICVALICDGFFCRMLGIDERNTGADTVHREFRVNRARLRIAKSFLRKFRSFAR